MMESIPRRIREAPGCRALRGAMLAAMTQPPARPGLSPRDHDHLVGPHRAPDEAGAGVVVLTGADLTIADVEAVARGGPRRGWTSTPAPAWTRLAPSWNGWPRPVRWS